MTEIMFTTFLWWTEVNSDTVSQHMLYKWIKCSRQSSAAKNGDNTDNQFQTS